ncbi:helix-turn-helix domain-containing protein [Mediannikoviicoccus vaginalis]|uniref:helix-turn-helix domain-containing protein n=1 Tax=Mediannikoviicoccus vaginalis TaxID=2899727 RepID=UPI001F3C1472|nr:helix-turn-helix domain-containing protein [Mediannikoviicoccus vaginalis]
MLLSQISEIKELNIKDKNIFSNEDIYACSISNSIDENNLNIITEDEIKNLNPTKGNFLIVNSNGEFKSKNKISYLHSSLDDAGKAMEILQPLIIENQKFLETIYSIICLDKGIESLLKEISSKFKDKVCILDNNKKLLYNPFDFNKVSELYPLKFISSNSSRMFAYLAFENSHEDEKESISKLCTIISNYIHKEVKNLQTSFDNFYVSLKNLLKGDFSDEDYKILKGLNWSAKDSYKVYVIQLEAGLFKYRDMFIHGNRFILDNPQYLFSILNQNHLILLINKTRLNRNKLEDEILEYITKYNLKYYSHDLKNKLSNFNKVYELSKFIFDNEVPISSDGQEELHSLMKPLLGQMDFLEILIPEILKPLLEHDLEKNSEFLKTLYLYLTEERSLIKVAEIMDIHRNSVVYRINRLSEIVDIDFEDSKTRYNLLIGIEILKELYPKILDL